MSETTNKESLLYTINTFLLEINKLFQPLSLTIENLNNWLKTPEGKEFLLIIKKSKELKLQVPPIYLNHK
ncbi:hypothetical protein M0H99_RS14975 [Proteus mirabilis]|uniref:Uncharacterized protein n=2 Tax=Proteus mirabilis TaxID=584 RepID=A0AAN1EVA3_PROMI|nr:hypothetical protein [Proteus mirabilis]ARX34060.1 hypothetical protein AM402_07810 [Proteus mirabilis]EJD6318100.1 hypothetical protein [Proteus mirabilis]EJD6322414.1 hypothetical protein [Proteus mirabilis]EJD6440786.1 hypothetical protein [Proteus mirabilis]EJD6695193.1 hypothetical protein [Proteus mirabilis]